MVQLVEVGWLQVCRCRHQGLSFPETGLVFSVLESKSHFWMGIKMFKTLAKICVSLISKRDQDCN